MEGFEEKKELLQQLETEVDKVESVRQAMEVELETAKTSGDFSKFYELQKKAKGEVNRAEAVQRKLEGKDFITEISADYKIKGDKGRIVGETITLNFETELANWTDFYTEHSLTLPANFAETMQDIWERNVSSIEKEISEKGFDKIIFIPASVDSVDLKKLVESMTADYKEEAKKAGKPENDTYLGFNLKEVVNSRTGDRIILLHSASDLTAQPELLKTLGKKYGGEKTDGTDNKAEDFIKAGEQLTLAEWLVLQREVWETTGVHIDGKRGEDSLVNPTWCPGSRLGKEAGSSVVRSFWHPDDSQVYVNALSPVYSYSNFGCRLSRCFK